MRILKIHCEPVARNEFETEWDVTAATADGSGVFIGGLIAEEQPSLKHIQEMFDLVPNAFKPVSGTV